VDVVNAPVPNEPEMPDAPLGDEVHEVLLVEDQLMVVLAPFAMDVDAAETDTVGTAEATLIVNF
jgi:hypothetical protein